MFLLECDSIPEVYTQVLQLVIEKGKAIQPRGYKCLEISPLCISASSPRKRLFGTPGRNENPIFAYIEGLWVLTADDSPIIPSHYVKQTLCYINPQTGRFDGAYGPRIRNASGIDQLTAAYQRLLNDRDTRRAVITIFDPTKDCASNSLDIPCTVSWQFLIRDNKLDMIAYMRSNDLFRGFVYDTAEFQWFQEILAGWLGVEVGKYFHIVGSAHVYLSDEAKIRKMLSGPSGTQRFSLYEASEPQDARLPRPEFEVEINNLASIEAKSRTAMLTEEGAEAIRSAFHCKFYRNLALAIAAYNFRRVGNIRLCEKLVDFIDNELRLLMLEREQFSQSFPNPVPLNFNREG
jgi:thymidylate synthase